MHPFQDGNGRTARAVEALVLQRAQLKDVLFVAMSNYYYDEKDAYLTALSEVRERNCDLTPFLKFGLRGIASQCRRLLGEIRTHVQKSLFRDVMSQMYGRLLSTRKRGLAQRQCELLTVLLDQNKATRLTALFDVVEKHYRSLRAPTKAYLRDLVHLEALKAVTITREGESYLISVRLEWSTEITETEFFRQINRAPKAKTGLIVSPAG